jgi:Tol biopolymer transport system component
VLIEAVIFGSSTENEGIWTYNLSNNEFKKLDLNKNYTGTPKLSPNHRYLLYNASTKSKDLHVSSNKIFVFDLLKRKEQLIFSEENAHITGLNWIK